VEQLGVLGARAASISFGVGGCRCWKERCGLDILSLKKSSPGVPRPNKVRVSHHCI